MLLEEKQTQVVALNEKMAQATDLCKKLREGMTERDSRIKELTEAMGNNAGSNEKANQELKATLAQARKLTNMANQVDIAAPIFISMVLKRSRSMKGT